MTIEVPEIMTTPGILASVTSDAIASADGVMPAPTILILSLTIISCTRRRATVADAAVVLDDEFDLAAGDLVAVAREIELGAGEASAADGAENRRSKPGTCRS